MIILLHRLLELKSDRRAVTALEYAIIAGVLGVTLVTAFTTFGKSLSEVFTTVAGKI